MFQSENCAFMFRLYAVSVRLLKISDFCLKFALRVKLDFREICLCHLKHIVRVGKEDIASLAVNGHELMFAFFESF